jgi:hypothetical protein
MVIDASDITQSRRDGLLVIDASDKTQSRRDGLLVKRNKE